MACSWLTPVLGLRRASGCELRPDAGAGLRTLSRSRVPGRVEPPLRPGSGAADGTYGAGWDQWLLALGLRLLSKRYQACRDWPLLVCGSGTFQRFWERPRHEPGPAARVWRSHRKRLGLGERVGWGGWGLRDSPGQSKRR